MVLMFTLLSLWHCVHIGDCHNLKPLLIPCGLYRLLIMNAVSWRGLERLSDATMRWLIQPNLSLQLGA